MYSKARSKIDDALPVAPLLRRWTRNNRSARRGMRNADLTVAVHRFDNIVVSPIPGLAARPDAGQSAPARIPRSERKGRQFNTAAERSTSAITMRVRAISMDGLRRASGWIFAPTAGGLTRLCAMYSRRQCDGAVTLDHSDQIDGIDGLGKEIVAAGVGAAFADVVHRVGGEGNDGRAIAAKSEP